MNTEYELLRSPIETLSNIQPNECDHSAATGDQVPPSSNPPSNPSPPTPSSPSTGNPESSSNTNHRPTSSNSITETTTLGSTEHNRYDDFLLSHSWESHLYVCHQKNTDHSQQFHGVYSKQQKLLSTHLGIFLVYRFGQFHFKGRSESKEKFNKRIIFGAFVFLQHCLFQVASSFLLQLLSWFESQGYASQK